ncbi:MAG: late competence development ComFB family protein [Eubacteriales bacterium]|nr:late competence development ComFB family protein [Eubacteriales bacterium]
MEIKNYTEVLVANKLDELIAKSGVCDCERCKADITAIALNKLSPKYVVSAKGECYAKLSLFENQFAIDVISTITKAIDIVSKNPRH